MSLSTSPLFPTLRNAYLAQLLGQLVHQHDVTAIYYTYNGTGLSYLVFHLAQRSDVVALEGNKWVRKLKEQHRTAVVFYYSSRLEHQIALGHPFVGCYCHDRVLLYNGTEPPANMTENGFKKYNKRFRAFREQFYHDYDLQESQVRHLVADGVGGTIFTAYGRLFDYLFQHLEELYCGGGLADADLNQRLSRLLDFAPALGQIFVRSRGGYYLFDVIAKAKEAVESEEFYYRKELCAAFGIAAQQLYDLVGQRYREMKKILKQQMRDTRLPLPSNDTNLDARLPEAVLDVLKQVDVEQIYMYHTVIYGSLTTSYLLLVANRVSNERLAQLNQTVNSIDASQTYVLICHDRYWIQRQLHFSQSFFVRVMQANQLVFSSHAFHPELHWEEGHEPTAGDLFLYRKLVSDTKAQIDHIVNSGRDNYQGLEELFSLYFISFCRCYIYEHLYYAPHYLSSKTLWQLCLYADEGLYRKQYLLDGFFTDFFGFVDRHRQVEPKLSRLREEEVARIREVVEGISIEK